MLQKLKDFIERQEQVDGEHLQILGSEAKLKQAARLWEMHGDSLETIAAVKLLNWVRFSEYTPNELAAYKTGLAEIALFLAECSSIVKEKEEQRKLLDNKRNL